MNQGDLFHTSFCFFIEKASYKVEASVLQLQYVSIVLKYHTKKINCIKL